MVKNPFCLLGTYLFPFKANDLAENQLPEKFGQLLWYLPLLTIIYGEVVVKSL